MEITVNNIKTDARNVGYRQMGFGQSVEKYNIQHFLIIIPVIEAVVELSQQYEKIALDLKADDAYRTLGLDPCLDLLASLKYPPLRDLIGEHPEIVESLIKSTMLDWREIFFPNRQDLQFVINSITTVRVNDSQILIHGDGFVPIDL